MKGLVAQPKLVEQVREAIVNEINKGRMVPGERVIQEQIARDLGVSRQPVQQALLLLRNDGVLRDAPGRGLVVAPLDLDYLKSVYDVCAVIEGLAFRKAAQINAERARKSGPTLIQKGRKAVKSKSVAAMIAADREFHEFIYEQSENPLITSAMQAQWTSAQRVMGEVLMRGARLCDIWDQHEALLSAVAQGNAEAAENLARHHVMQAASFMTERLRNQRQPMAGSIDTDSNAPKVRATKNIATKADVAKGGAAKTSSTKEI
jgi:DNA-binding GntR family transcriptional regulator